MNNDNLFFPNILELTENLSPGDTVNMDINKFLLEKVKIKIAKIKPLINSCAGLNRNFLNSSLLWVNRPKITAIKLS